jgi:hypothetical protein
VSRASTRKEKEKKIIFFHDDDEKKNFCVRVRLLDGARSAEEQMRFGARSRQVAETGVKKREKQSNLLRPFF